MKGRRNLTLYFLLAQLNYSTIFDNVNPNPFTYMLFRFMTFALCVCAYVLQAQPIKAKRFFNDDGYSVDSTQATWKRIYTVISDSTFQIENFKISGTPILSARCYCESYKRKMYVDATMVTPEQFKLFAVQCKPVYHGELKQFYNNGNVEFIGPYAEGKKQGLFTYWYWNGNKKGEYAYHDTLKMDYAYRIINHYDSLGKQMVFNGEGTCTLFEKSDDLIETGKIVNGFKQDEWQGTAWKGKLAFTEQYQAGNLQKGISIDSTGTFTYQKIFVNAEYKNGAYNGLARLVGQNVKYPTRARRMGIEGTVHVQFIIDRQGQMIEVEVVRSIDAECDSEAKRVVLLANNASFTPAVYRGKNVKSKYILPVTFRLQ